MSEPHEELFKYREYLNNKYVNCPPGDYVELEMEAWRWVFVEDLEEAKNFSLC